MRKFKLGLGLAAAAALLAGCPALAETTVLKDMTLIDGTGKSAEPHSALVMTDGKITWVGPVAQLKAPAGAKVVDLSGKFVMPGLIDNHVHVGIMHDQTQDIKYYTRQNVEADLKTYVAYGVTTVQILGTDKDLIFDIRKEERAGRPHYARVFTAGQGEVYKGGYGGVLGLNVPVSTPAEAIKSVDEQAAKGVDIIKLWMDDEHHTIPVKMTYDVSKAIIAEAHKHHLKAVAHIYYLADAKELARQGIDGFAHEIRDQPVDKELLDLMKSHGTWQMAPTLSREIAYASAILPYLQDPFFVRGVTPGTLAFLRSSEREKNVVLGYTRFPGLPYQKKVFWDMDRVFYQALGNFATEAKAGVSYGMGTDSGPAGRYPGFNAHEELQLMVMDGLTPMQAIVAATSSNAKWLGDSSIGSIAAGKWGDLLVLDKNPLADIRNTETVAAVYIAGNSVPTIWQTCRDRPVNTCPAEPSNVPDMPY
ncbi:MAG TPA: amidohydrolase family protein [Rhizomicrobium sp.]|nr:amidohydrolase family protein [Rhizomicrobium sp.]